MRFDPFTYEAVKPGSVIDGPQGGFRVVCHPSAAVFVQADGYEVLASYGSCDLQITGAYSFRVVGADDAPASYRLLVRSASAPVGETFTNLDRMPNESGSVLAVTSALRKMKLEQNAFAKELREERRKLAMERAKGLSNKEATDPSETDETDDISAGDEENGAADGSPTQPRSQKKERAVEK